MNTLRHWKVVLAVVLVFGAGAVTGSVLSFVHFKRAFEHGFTVENWNAMTMKILKKELKLTPEQEPKVRVFVVETGEQFRQTFGHAFRVAGTNLVVCWDRVDQVLTPEQHVIYQRKCEEFRQKLKKDLGAELPPAQGRKQQ